MNVSILSLMFKSPRLPLSCLKDATIEWAHEEVFEAVSEEDRPHNVGRVSSPVAGSNYRHGRKESAASYEAFKKLKWSRPPSEASQTQVLYTT